MLLERDRELGLMADSLTEVGPSGGKVVLIRGEAGIGKSALVGEFIEHRRDEAHVHVGSCDDLLTPQPLGPFWDVARDQSALRKALDNGDRPGVLQATLDLLSRSLRSTILVIEDTHWADEATLDAIKYFGRRIAKTNGLLVLTYRDGEVDYDHPLRAVIGDLPPQSVVRIQLAGLSLSAVSAIISESTLAPDDVLAATNGNPFLVTEMASAGEGIPASVQDSVMVRVGRLSPHARESLKMLSVIPERIAIAEAAQLTGISQDELAECERNGLLDVGVEFVSFRHDLILQAVEASLSVAERVKFNADVLAYLPPGTDAARLVHHARRANDVDRLVVLAPQAARAAAAMGSHREATEHFRQLTPYLDRLPSEEVGPILDEWAEEEGIQDNLSEAIDLNEMAVNHYRELGDRSAESRALCQAARFVEVHGQRHRAEEFAHKAVEILGLEPDGSELARALEANAYLAMMAGDILATRELVNRTLAVADPVRDERIIIRSLNHRGIMEHLTDYPDGRASLDEARDRSEAAGLWYEEARALLNQAWAAAEFRDLQAGSDYAQRAIASGARHELRDLESYSSALYARVKDVQGDWSAAEDLARDQLESSRVTQMVSLPIVGIIEARTGRATAQATLTKAWEMASNVDEFQRLGPAAAAVAEYAWITGIEISKADRIVEVMEMGREAWWFKWSRGAIAIWLWKLGELTSAPTGIAEPFRLLIEGEPMAAAEMWSEIGSPYQRAVALAHGDEEAQLEALEVLETLAASAVAAKLRKAMRDQGLSVPRGKGRATRDHAAGLTARQAEVLEFLAEGLSNTEIADHLFVSPRTIENHVAAVLSKLDSSTREEAVSRARAEGILAVVGS